MGARYSAVFIYEIKIFHFDSLKKLYQYCATYGSLLWLQVVNDDKAGNQRMKFFGRRKG